MKRTIAALCLLTFPLLAAACDSEIEGVVDGVTITMSGGSAVYGGCGDAGPWPIPEAGVTPCGSPQDFSFTVSLDNADSAVKKVTVGKVEVWGETGNKPETTTTVTGATSSGAAFDGTVPAGKKLTVKYSLSSYALYTGLTHVIYRVTFKVGDKATTISSPLVPFSGPPA